MAAGFHCKAVTFIISDSNSCSQLRRLAGWMTNWHFSHWQIWQCQLKGFIKGCWCLPPCTNSPGWKRTMKDASVSHVPTVSDLQLSALLQQLISENRTQPRDSQKCFQQGPHFISQVLVQIPAPKSSLPLEAAYNWQSLATPEFIFCGPDDYFIPQPAQQNQLDYNTRSVVRSRTWTKASTSIKDNARIPMIVTKRPSPSQRGRAAGRGLKPPPPFHGDAEFPAAQHRAAHTNVLQCCKGIWSDAERVITRCKAISILPGG